jgi:hypothetical protein
MEISGNIQAPADLPPREKRPRYPLDRRLGGPQSRFGRVGEEKDIASFPRRESNSGTLAHNTVTVLTELLWLSTQMKM